MCHSSSCGMQDHRSRRLPWELLIVFVFLYNQSVALKCYVGSKGLSKNGKVVHSFLPNECEEDMTHCFKSYTDDLTQVTASCQSLNTEQRLLDVCKDGCRNHIDLNVTICCCDSDLCNQPWEDRGNATDSSESKVTDPIESEENNETIADGSDKESISDFLEEILKYPTLLRIPQQP